LDKEYLTHKVPQTLDARIKDSIVYLSSVNPLRFWNLIKLWSSYFLSVLMGRAMHLGMPAGITIEPTTSCNLQCPECPSGRRSFERTTGKIELEDFKTYLDQVAKYVSYLTLYFQGEPYLHPELFQMINYARNKNLYTSVSTNAHFLDPASAEKTISSGLNRLIVSVDGLDQDTYSFYRVGGDLETVLKGIATLTLLKKKMKSPTPFVILQSLVLKPNQHQVNGMYALGRSLMVDKVELKSAQIYDYAEADDLIPDDPRYSRYKKDKTGKYQIRSNLPGRCWRMWSSAVITWDGLVVPCCFDKNAKHKLGSIKNNDFRKIWKGEDYQSFRNEILTARKQVEICRNCTEGLKPGQKIKQS
jgi:radical SAM protein with 4Fe4S-binding SPASM domain